MPKGLGEELAQKYRRAQQGIQKLGAFQAQLHRLNVRLRKAHALYAWGEPSRSRYFTLFLLAAALALEALPFRLVFSLGVLGAFASGALREAHRADGLTREQELERLKTRVRRMGELELFAQDFFRGIPLEVADSSDSGEDARDDDDDEPREVHAPPLPPRAGPRHGGSFDAGDEPDDEPEAYDDRGASAGAR